MESSFSLTFAGASRACRNIPITDDEEPEPLQEHFNLTLMSDDPLVVLMPPTTTVTIEDDDGQYVNLINSIRHPCNEVNIKLLHEVIHYTIVSYQHCKVQLVYSDILFTEFIVEFILPSYTVFENEEMGAVQVNINQLPLANTTIGISLGT